MQFTQGANSSHSTRILIVGLNPVLDRFISLPELQFGAVNRATSLQIEIGGKGQNAVVALKCLQSDPAPTLLQFLGKSCEGDALLSMLQSKTDSIISIRTNARCRMSVNLLQQDQTTEIIEPNENLESKDIEELFDTIDREYHEMKPKYIAVMGSLPQNSPDELYSQVLFKLVSNGSLVLIDTVRDVVNSIVATCKNGGTCVLKVNMKEMITLAGKEYRGDHSMEELHEVVRQFALAIPYESWNLIDNLYIAVTYGSKPSHFFQISYSESDISTFKHWVVEVPSLDKEVVSPVGAGDTTSAGTLHFLSQLESDTRVNGVDSILDAFRWGLACGTGSIYSARNSVFNLDEVKNIFARSTTTLV